MLEEGKQQDLRKMGLQSQKRRSLFSILFHSRTSKSANVDVETSSNNNSVAAETGSEHWSDCSGEELRQLENRRRRSSNTIQDQDSYVFDLNERLVQEKLNQGQSSEDEADQLKRCAKESSPIKDSELGVHRCSSEKQLLSRSEPPQTNTSTLLEQFLKSHKISLDSKPADNQLVDSKLDLISSSSSSEPSSLASIELHPEELSRSRASTPVQERAARERDLRLVHWRLKAAKSIWSANSLPSSDSELDLLDCQSPALVISCSDDTSCSSVELIWTPRDTSMHPREDNHDPRTPSLTPDDDKREAALHKVPPVAVNGRQRFLQRLSIFELAKPSRARARRRRKSTRASPAAIAEDAQWVPNPLFGVGSTTEKSTKRFRKSASYESVMAKPKALGVEENNNIKQLETAVSSSDEAEATISDNDYSQPEEDGLTNTVKKGSKSSSSASRRKRDNIYLNHIMNLNRGIKSNVSSIKSQLSVKISDTSKRASVLADQLLTSIKDTTKEQLFSGWPTADRTANGLNASSFSIPQNLDSNMADSDANNKARLFSLIYKHQQQANGKPVITRQPMPIGGLNSISKPPSPSPLWLATDQQSSAGWQSTKVPPPRPAPPKSYGSQSDGTSLTQIIDAASKIDRPDTQSALNEIPSTQTLVQEEERAVSRSSIGIQTSPVPALPQSETTTTGIIDRQSLVGNFLKRRKSDRFLTTSSDTRTRRRRFKKATRIAPSSDEDDDDEHFYQNEYTRLKSSLAAKDDLNRHQSQIRTLNYWRRYKMRKLGADYNQMCDYVRDRSHSLDLSDLKRTGAS